MNKNDVREIDLVTQALAGDSASFGMLYELYLDEMYQFVFYKVKGHQEAEDLTEVVFLKAWQALDENPPAEIPFRLWLYRIARNTIIDHYRTRKSQADIEEAIAVAETNDGPEALVVRRERVEELRDKLQMLNEDQQEVLTCRFVMGLSHAETAVVMSRTEQAVRALQYRAIVALRDLLTIEQVTATLTPYTNGNRNGNVNGTSHAHKAHVANGRTLTKEESNHV